MKSFIIHTERLFLRKTTPNDAETMFLLNADPEVIRYTGDPPFASVEEARRFLENYDAYRRTGMGRWAVVRKDDGAVLGWCGLKLDEGEVDLGYRLSRAYWGNGYATEAAFACLSYGFEELQLESIIGRAMHGNHGSIRVLEKCGMTYEKDTDCADCPSRQFRILKKDFHFPG